MDTTRRTPLPLRFALVASLVAATMSGLVLGGPTASAAARPTAARAVAPLMADGVRLNGVEARLLDRINAARAARKLVRLRVAPGYTDVARRWSAKLAGSNVLRHNPAARAQLENSGGTGWRVLGENVGYGGDADSLFNAYWNSPPHRANILNPSYRYIGIGWVTRADGSGYNTQNFVTCYAAAYGPTRVAVRGA